MHQLSAPAIDSIWGFLGHFFLDYFFIRHSTAISMLLNTFLDSNPQYHTSS